MSASEALPPEESLRAALLHRVAAGDRSAMQDLYLHERPTLFRLFHRLSRCEAWSEDLLQGTFLDLWRYRRNFQGRGRASAYLYRVAIHQWRRSVSRERRRREVHEELVREVPPRDEPEPICRLERQELREKMWRVIQELPDRQKETFLLHRFHGLSAREISEATGDRIKTVESRLRLSIEKLREKLRLPEGHA